MEEARHEPRIALKLLLITAALQETKQERTLTHPMTLKREEDQAQRKGTGLSNAEAKPLKK